MKIKRLKEIINKLRIDAINQRKPMDYIAALWDCLDALCAEENKTLEDFDTDWAFRDTTTYDYSQVKSYSFSPYNVCEGCSNNPQNGGSGICCCSLPDMYTYNA